MPDTHVYTFGPFRLSPSRRHLDRDGVAIPLTPKAFDTLVALVERRDQVVTREELLSHLWPSVAVEEANLTQQVFLVRKALDEAGTGEQYVATVPRRGYRFVKDVAILPLEEEPAATHTWYERRPAIGALMLLAATAAVVGFVLVRSEDPPSYTIWPVATAEGVESMPAWSPDGRTLAYGSEINGYYQILTQAIDPSSPTPVRLTNLEADCLFPAWNPTGSRIFFVRRTSSSSDLWVVDAAGGEPQRFMDDVLAFTVAPTIGAFALIRPDGADDVALWHADEDGSEVRRLGRGGAVFGSQTFLAFSPDERWLGMRGAGLLLVPYPFDEKPFERSLNPRFKGPEGTVGPYNTFSWVAARDQRDQIVFPARDRTGDAQLWIGDLGRLTAWPLGSSSQWELMPAVSRTGRIAFTMSPMDWDILEIPLDSPELRPLVVGARFDGGADWMPNGRELVFSTQRTGRFEIRRRNLDDATDRVLMAPAKFRAGVTQFFSQSDVSPDGTRLAFKAAGHIYLQSMLGSEPVRLTNTGAGGPREDHPSWSPDGQSVVFRSRLTRIMTAPATGEVPATLLAEDSSLSMAAEPKWASGGNDIVYVSSDGLRRMSRSGGASRIVTRETPLTWDVAPDGRTAFAILEGPRRAMRLARIDLTTGDVRVIADLGQIPISPMPIGYQPTLQALRVSPDGARLALSRLNARSDIYIREPRLPVTQ